MAARDLEYLRPHATPRQMEVLDALIRYGSHRPAADALGVHHSYIGRVVKSLEAKALNLTGRAGGAFYTAMPDGSIHASLVDTQEYEGLDGYEPLAEYRASNPKSEAKARGPGTTIFEVRV